MRPLRVLIVDDDIDLVEIWSDFLQGEGCDVSALPPARGLLDEFAAGRHSADVVITDYRLPGFSGLELAAAIRSRPGPAAVILATGNDISKLRTPFPGQVLGKPVPLASLIDAVRRAAQPEHMMEGQETDKSDE